MENPLHFKVERDVSGAFFVTSAQLPGLLVAKMSRNEALNDLPRALDEYAAAQKASDLASPVSTNGGE